METINRCFVVGNGPSLRDTDLDLLKREVTFATNRINLHYEYTDWRPTYYIRAEGFELMSQPSPELWVNDLVTHMEDRSVEVHANLYFSKHMQRLGLDSTGIIPLNTCAHYETHFHYKDCPHMWHLPVLCSYGSSVNVAIQMAVQKGFREIYLVGCDLGYVDGGKNHMSPDYENGYEKHLRSARYANTDTLNAHIIASRSSPVPIYNATIGGSLEVYERVDYYEILGGRKRPKP
jgi:hypothetical protein